MSENVFNYVSSQWSERVLLVWIWVQFLYLGWVCCCYIFFSALFFGKGLGTRFAYDVSLKILGVVQDVKNSLDWCVCVLC